ncbi:histone H5-like [Anopheles ziemanni]|uniref:histone H5-like n=1 Tax=Anopheles coustani TaxID=139045 RepID=UPI00265A9D8F|nr:histone H5-like [Anopheles coustani]XP_058175248.1 histone H5-like [Anopheles ziemanni]
MEGHVPESIDEPLRARRILFSSDTPKDTSTPIQRAPTIQAGPTMKQKSNKKSYEQMMLEAITENDPNRKGLSFTMIQKFVKGRYTIDGDIKIYVKKAYEKLLQKNVVEHVTGKGLIGSIRLSKAHVEDMKKSEKLAIKAEKIKQKEKTAAKKSKKKKADKNNNEKDGKKSKVKPKEAAKPKKTAITKVKIDRKGGKVRLSIAANPVPRVKGAKTKAKEGKVKGSKTQTNAPEPKPSTSKPAQKAKPKTKPMIKAE